jgi:hypothetical protein
MKRIIAILLIVSAGVLASCDVRSETAKREMEKYTSTPEPMGTPTPTATPVNMGDVVKVDTSVEGPNISVDGYDLKKSVACPKYNRVLVNGDRNNLTVTGVCQQIMLNGDANEVTADAAAEFVINGSKNIMRYSRFANGEPPKVVENQQGNTIEKVESTGELPARKNVK